MRKGSRGEYKHTPEAREKIRQAKLAEKNPNWLGEKASTQAGRERAQRLYAPRPCEVCANPKSERHHKDGNTQNNAATNIAFLCRKHHMEADGRLKALIQMARANRPTERDAFGRFIGNE